MADINKIRYNGVDYEIEREDSGWITAQLTTEFTQSYNEGFVDEFLRFRRIGNTVEITGVVSPVKEIATTSETTIFNLPEGFRPDKIRWFHVQADQMKVCCIIIHPNGQVTLSRYGIESKDPMPISGIAFIQCTFLVD